MPLHKPGILQDRSLGASAKLESAIQEAAIAGKIAAQEHSAIVLSDGNKVECGSSIVGVFCPTHRFREALKTLKPNVMEFDLKWPILAFDDKDVESSAQGYEEACEVACTILGKHFPSEVFVFETCFRFYAGKQLSGWLTAHPSPDLSDLLF